MTDVPCEPSAVYRLHQLGHPVADIANLLHMTHPQLGVAMRKQAQEIARLPKGTVIINHSINPKKA